jgi:hypothetical protein
LFDEFYSSAAEDITNHVFNGFTGTRMIFDTNSTSWKIFLIDDQDIYAEMESVEKWQDEGVPLGTHLFNPSTKLGGHKFNINMNVCKDEEYNCRDGTCIQIVER